MANVLYKLPPDFFDKCGEKKKIFFYGAGGMGMFLARHSAALSVFGLEPDYYVDQNLDKTNTYVRTYNYYLNGHKTVPVISLDECKKMGLDNPIVVTIRISQAIVKMLENYGFSNVWILPISEDNYDGDGLKKQLRDAEKSIRLVYEQLYDEQSREVFRCIMGIRCGKEKCQKDLIKMAVAEKYMPKDIFMLLEDAVIIDAGALDGDTAVEFAEKTAYTYQKIYSFEPNPEMMPKLLARNLPRHEIVEKALSSSEGKACFMLGGKDTTISEAGSRLSDFGNYEVELVSLDSMLPDILPPTYIKMDIEGAELQALEGMDEVIRCYHPILAVCIYHKPLDIFEIPLYLMEKYPFYRFYIRHHSETNYDTVLYCVPQNGP